MAWMQLPGSKFLRKLNFIKLDNAPEISLKWIIRITIEVKKKMWYGIRWFICCRNTLMTRWNIAFVRRYNIDEDKSNDDLFELLCVYNDFFSRCVWLIKRSRRFNLKNFGQTKCRAVWVLQSYAVYNSVYYIYRIT